MDVINIKDANNQRKEQPKKLDGNLSEETSTYVKKKKKTKKCLYPEFFLLGKKLQNYFNGEYDWWSAKDVCDLLKIDDIDQAVAELDPHEKLEIVFKYGSNDSQSKKVTAINGDALFYLLLRSNEPIAVKFKRWLIYNVLPEIFTGDGLIQNIDFSITDELEELGLFPSCIF